MDTRLQKDICHLANIGRKFKDIDRQIIKQHLPTELQYCCYYWIHHLKQSQGSISGFKIISFLQKRFLHWLEALALMGKISEAKGMIDTLDSITCVSGERLRSNIS